MDIFQQHQFSQPIFQVQVDPLGPRLAVECRDQVRQTVTFGVLDLELGEWKSSPESFPWWTGLSQVHASHLVLEEYAEKTLPVRQGVQVISPLGQTLWENPSCKLIGQSLSGPLVRDQDQNQFLLAINSNGKPERQPLTIKGLKALQDDYQDWEQDQLLFPNPQEPKGSAWETWLKATPPVQLPIPMLEMNDWTLGAWHQATDTGYTLLLGATHASGQSHQWTLETGMPAMHPEPFFVFRNRLICTSNRQTLAWSSPIHHWSHQTQTPPL